MAPEPQVTGEIVRLRPLSADDAEAIVAGAGDPDVFRQTGVILPGTLDEAASWIGRVAADARRVDLAITSLDDDTMIGQIVLDDLDLAGRRARLQMWMLPGHRGRGYGREAIYRMLELAFEPAPRGFGLHRVGLRVPALNPRAQSLYESFGFRDEGRMRDYFRDGEGHVDALVMGLLESELEAEHGMFSPSFRRTA